MQPPLVEARTVELYSIIKKKYALGGLCIGGN